MMKLTTTLPIFLIVLSLISAACGSADSLATEQPTQTTVLVESTQSVIPSQPLANNPTINLPVATDPLTPALTTFQDPNYGFIFYYPTGWVLDTISFGSRAPASYQLTSWDHAPGLVDVVPAGETILNLTIQLWDPQNDLNAFAENRQIAWNASGFSLTSVEDLVLANGIPAKSFTITTTEGSEGYFLLTIYGGDYLVVSGNGDLALVDLVARSIR
jgi:hypothetical protein